MPSGSSDSVGDPSALPLLGATPAPGTGLGAAEGLICGKRLAAFPAPIREVFALLSSGSGPIPTLFAVPSPSGPSEVKEDE